MYHGNARFDHVLDILATDTAVVALDGYRRCVEKDSFDSSTGRRITGLVRDARDEEVWRLCPAGMIFGEDDGWLVG